jgi:hypothetical protein
MRFPALWMLILTLSAAGTGGFVAADESDELSTLMTKRGKLLLADDLNQPLAGKWRVAKGEWKVEGDAVRVSELAADKHGAVARHPLPLRDFVVQYSFQLDGARATTLSINNAKGHCCRVLIGPGSLAVQKDSHDHNQADKAAVLDKRAATIAPGQWHTLVAEVCGGEIVARIDGRIVAFGQHDSLAVEKTNFGLTVGGQSAAFKNLRVWEAAASDEWEAAKKQLAKDRAATPQAGK